MNIQEKVRQHRQRWLEANKYVMPNLTDALDFMLTEVAEAIDQRLRQANYVRNNPTFTVPSNRDIAIEVFDAIMMGCVALDILQEDIDEIAELKLKQMDIKRGLT